MKRTILLLLLANAVVLAWQQGLFGPGPEAGREPQRLALQIAPEKIRVLQAEQLASLRQAATGKADGGGLGCVAFGDFDEASLGPVQARLAELGLGERLQQKQVEATNGFIVYLPPATSRAEAERLAKELRGRGERDAVVLGPETALANAILLGSFRDEEAAQRHQADLARRGVRGAVLGARPAGAAATRFEIRDLDAALAQRLAEVQREFPQSRLGACGP